MIHGTFRSSCAVILRRCGRSFPGNGSDTARQDPDGFPVTACLWTIRVQGQCSVADERGAWPVRGREQSQDELRTRTGLNHGLLAWTIVAQLRRDQWPVIHGEISRLAAQKSCDAARDAAGELLGRCRPP